MILSFIKYCLIASSAKLNFMYLLTIMLLSSSLISFAQISILEREIELPEQNTTVEIFLEVLGQKAECSFTYSNEIPLSKKVSLEAKKQTIQEYLNEIFKGDSLRYIEKSKKIIILPLDTRSSKNTKGQVIRGYVLDTDSKLPLEGANLLLESEKPYIGAVSDHNGYFIMDKLPVGLHSLKVSYIGYQSVQLPNILVLTGKESVVNIYLEESVTKLNDVTVISNIDRTKPVNDLAFVSSRRISAMEVEYCPGSLGDISRAAVSFPGVLSANDGQNHLIIRGNSPKGLQWRMEGIELPNLNHFAEIGSSGGGIGIVSNNMIGASDFISSAFPAEYGNALSGVFDLTMRKGNNEQHEQTFQVGLIGLELMVEGPINRNKSSSYITQYRYSTMMLIKRLGLELTSVPEFQDLSFKLSLPTKNAGIFTVFGIGGLSSETGAGDFEYEWGSNTFTLGFSNKYYFDAKTSLNSIVAFSGWNYRWDEDENIGSAETPIDYKTHSDVAELTAKISVSINRKINARHKLRAGVVFDNTYYDTYMGWQSDTLFDWLNNPNHPNHSENITYQQTYSDDNGNAQTVQLFGNWKYRITDNLMVNTGLHFIQFYLNNNYSIEPRFGVSWQFIPKHTLTGGFGIHSRKESLTLYTGQKTLHDGEVIQPNTNLELTKAMHFVLGYSYQINQDLILKAEVYYQYLYDIPVYPFPPYFSTINFDYGFEGNILVNEGTAYNKGIELSVEKFFSKGYQVLFNGTLYGSKYRNYLGEEYDTKYNGSYAANGLFIKEFRIGKKRQNIINIGARCIYMGGMRYLPIDLASSLSNNGEVKIWDYGFSEKADDYFRLDFQVSFIRNAQKHTGEWRLDIINVTNKKNMLFQRYNNNLRMVETKYQNPFIPLLTYRIKF